MVKTRREAHFLDRPPARFCAVGLALLMAGVLVFMHRDDLFPPDQAAVSEDPVARCLAERAGDIDKMAAEGTITAEQASLFKGRAAALCQSQMGGGNSAPPPLPTR